MCFKGVVILHTLLYIAWRRELKNSIKFYNFLLSPNGPNEWRNIPLHPKEWAASVLLKTLFWNPCREALVLALNWEKSVCIEKICLFTFNSKWYLCWTNHFVWEKAEFSEWEKSYVCYRKFRLHLRMCVDALNCLPVIQTPKVRDLRNARRWCNPNNNQL